MTDLSPAAQAILNAVTLNRYDVPYYACPKSINQIKSDVAAALLAAADQVVPASPDMIPSLIMVRYRLLAISNELEAR